ncbi:MAG: hypothetical protein J2O46_10755, partial [Nocardioides sp.]|nr:hypothetical protein [Nocardioides sp.]
FDDPAGRVGIECTLLQVGSTVVHLPATYRGAPLEGAERYLMATTDHSALGKRWVYDACADPVAVKVLLGAALSGAVQEPMDVYDDGELVARREAKVTAKGTGSWKAAAAPHHLDGVTIRSLGASATVEAAGFALEISRVVGSHGAAGTEGIDVAWPGGSGRLVGVRHL